MSPLPTMVSYFSGGGLAEAGIRDLFRVIGAVEFDPAIASWYHRVNPEVDLRVEDVCTVDPSAWVGVDLFHASPSCRNASNANQEAGETPEDIAAGKAVERGIRIMRPKLFTLENVRGYRHFTAFSGIVSCLKAEGYRVDYRVYNAASWGVPQTRERLYLRAWKLNKPLPWIAPTHQERQKLIDAPGADMFADEPLKPWVGWYESLCNPAYGRNLLPTLPPSSFAKWQLARLPEEITSCLVKGENACSEGDIFGGCERPAFTVTNSAASKAFLVENLATVRDATVRNDDDPAFTMTTANCGNRPAHMPSAYLVDGHQTVPGPDGERMASVRDGNLPSLTVCGSAWKGLHSALLVERYGARSAPGGEIVVRQSEEPSWTVRSSPRQCETNALLVEGDAAGARCPTTRYGDEPSFVIKAAEGGRVHRAVSGGVVVKMTPEALARFQMGIYAQGYPLPEKLKLACQIIGNGCCSEFMRVVILSMMEGLL